MWSLKKENRHLITAVFLCSKQKTTARLISEKSCRVSKLAEADAANRDPGSQSDGHRLVVKVVYHACRKAVRSEVRTRKSQRIVSRITVDIITKIAGLEQHI